MPKKSDRSQLRLQLGRWYYTLKRHLEWQFSGVNFATQLQSEKLEYQITNHQSILLRQLPQVDMWLQHNKITNLRLAINQLDGLIIAPGQVFSFWYLVGDPTKSRGFQVGMTLQNGKVKPGYGGGMCQLANLIYWMTLHTPLTIKERWRHSYDVFPDVNRTLPFGSGATIAYNYIDLQITNETNQDFQLCLGLTTEYLQGEIRSNLVVPYTYKVVERNHQITGPIASRYTRHNQLFRQVFSQGSSREDRSLEQNNLEQFVREEFITENYALMMYAPLLGGAIDPPIVEAKNIWRDPEQSP